MYRVSCLVLLAALASACAPAPSPESEAAKDTASELPRTFAPDARERHFSELSMLTDGGENAEAYFSFAGDRLIFQSTRPPYECDQIFTMNLDGSDVELVSTGKGRTTCAYFLPGDEKIIYSSTHHHDPACPVRPDMSQGYVWPLYESYDVFVANADGSGLRQLTDTPGYDAEATVSPAGDRIVFTSVRDGDLEIYTMALDGSDLRRLTFEEGYDGGPFFSPDGSKIVYRSYHPKDDEELADYRRLLGQGLIRPGKLEIYVMDADGSNKTRVTELDAASFGPFFHPSGEKIVFSSNYPDGRREFEMWMVDLDGKNLEQVTFSREFDGFPMFSPNGELFVFGSNRHHSNAEETNIFITRWKE